MNAKKKIPWNKGKKQSEETKEKIKNSLTGRKLSEETKEKMKGRIPWNKGKTNVYSNETKEKLRQARLGSVMTFETKQKISSALTGKPKSEQHKQKLVEHLNKLNLIQKYDLDEYKKNHPFLFKVEELREHPETKEIQVHCKNHNCPNSKEHGGWFTPTRSQLYERIRQLEHPEGNDGNYFYCCDECKLECPLFKKTGTKIKTKRIYTESEYNTWKQEVFKRQKDELGHNECEICGNKNIDELSVHHEKPQKLNSILSLDPDNGIILCGSNSKNKCHYKYGHKDECSTGKLSSNVLCF